MRRREFIAGLGGAVAWPLAARAQPAERVRRIGFLSFTNEMDQLARAQTVLLEALAKLGWVEGRNLRIDVRGAADRPRACGVGARRISRQSCGLSAATIRVRTMSRAVPSPPQNRMRSTPAARNFLVAALAFSAEGLPAGVCTTF